MRYLHNTDTAKFQYVTGTKAGFDDSVYNWCFIAVTTVVILGLLAVIFYALGAGDLINPKGDVWLLAQ